MTTTSFPRNPLWETQAHCLQEGFTHAIYLRSTGNRIAEVRGKSRARLIAAAPDLLAALEIAIRALQDNNLDESMAGEFEILTDAIAKALA